MKSEWKYGPGTTPQCTGILHHSTVHECSRRHVWSADDLLVLLDDCFWLGAEEEVEVKDTCSGREWGWG